REEHQSWLMGLDACRRRALTARVKKANEELALLNKERKYFDVPQQARKYEAEFRAENAALGSPVALPGAFVPARELALRGRAEGRGGGVPGRLSRVREAGEGRQRGEEVGHAIRQDARDRQRLRLRRLLQSAGSGRPCRTEPRRQRPALRHRQRRPDPAVSLG